MLLARKAQGNEIVSCGSCWEFLSCVRDGYITLAIIVLQKAEENAEGGESALGPDGEVREVAPTDSYVLLGESVITCGTILCVH